MQRIIKYAALQVKRTGSFSFFLFPGSMFASPVISRVHPGRVHRSLTTAVHPHRGFQGVERDAAAAACGRRLLSEAAANES